VDHVGIDAHKKESQVALQPPIGLGVEARIATALNQ